MDKKIWSYSFKGLIKACIATLIAMIIFSIINFFFPASDNTRGIFILVVTLLSIMYGSIYAAKKSSRKGWIIGLILSFMYIMFFYVISVLAGRNTMLVYNDYIRIALALLVGTLSGMLGINI